MAYLGSRVQSCCGEGGLLQTDITGVCGERSQCLGHTGFAPLMAACAFPAYTAQAPGRSAGELSKAGPGLRALPRSKLLRFRFSGAPQRRRLSWASVLWPVQVRAAQAARCLASAHSPGGPCVSSPPPLPAPRPLAPSQPLGFLGFFLGAPRGRRPSCGVCLLCGADVWLRPPGGCLLSGIPGRCGSQLGACSQFGRGCRLPALAGARLPPCLRRGWAGALPASSPLVFAQCSALRAAQQCLGLELFVGKFSLSLCSFSLSLWLPHSLGCYLS